MPGRSFHLYSNRESKIWISVEMPSRQSDKLIAINCKSIKMYPLGTIYTCTKSSSYHIYNCWNISVLTKTMDHPFHMIPSIQRAPVYDTYFFHAVERVFVYVCFYKTYFHSSTPDILCVCLSVYGLQQSMPLIQSPLKQEKEVDCLIVCWDQTVIRPLPRLPLP